jgi:hypothetical protein
LVADGSLSVPVEATYRLDDYCRAIEHAGTPKRGGKVLFAFDVVLGWRKRRFGAAP